MLVEMCRAISTSFWQKNKTVQVLKSMRSISFALFYLKQGQNTPKWQKSQKTFLPRHLAETEGFEPSCPLPDNRISSAARYDHFDTFPQIFNTCDKIIVYLTAKCKRKSRLRAKISLKMQSLALLLHTIRRPYCTSLHTPQVSRRREIVCLPSQIVLSCKKVVRSKI